MGTKTRGVFQSTDHGVGWTNAITGLTNIFIDAIAFNSSDFILSGTKSGMDGKLFRSTNQGETWTEMTIDMPFTTVNSLAFNPSTKITYSLPIQGDVDLGVYNLAGQLVRTLQDNIFDPGCYTLAWNVDTNSGSKVTSGVNIVRLHFVVGDHRWIDSRKMVVLQ